jgi:cell wall-associated NlpC family hydrolase
MRVMRLIAVVPFALLLAACAAREPTRQELALRQQMLETALGQIGRPYRYGGGDGDGFDCSGLVQYVYLDAGLTVPRTAKQQMRAGEKIDPQEALPGDLMFFDTDSGVHVAFYVGGGRVVHAPSRGKDVTVTPVDGYWRERRVATVRLMPE